MPSRPFSIIEVGTSRTVILVGQCDAPGHISILAAATNDKMTGIRKSTVINAPNARTGITTAIDRARQQTEVPEKNTFLIVSGGNVNSDIVVNSLLTNGTITSGAINNSIQNTIRTNSSALTNRSILHSVRQDTVICEGSSKRTVQDPEGLSGDRCDTSVLLIHCDDAIVRDLHSVVEDAHLHVSGLLFSAACSSRAVLSEEQRNDGVLLLDIGAGTTCYALHQNGFLLKAGSIPIGGDHATNDLAQAFTLRTSDAEDLKVTRSSAIVGDARPEDTAFVSSSGMLGQNRILNLRDVNTVVNARFDELFRVVFSQLGMETHFKSVVLVGGCALQKGILKVAEDVFHCPCAIGSILDGTNFGNARNDPLFATAYGALYVANDELTALEAQPSSKPKGTFLHRLLSIS